VIDKPLLCAGKVYRGVIVVTFSAGDQTKTVVIGTANRQAVQLYEAADFAEAVALIDAALALTTLPCLPVRETDGGARAVGLFGNGSIQTA
jgi:hypothetical protein